MPKMPPGALRLKKATDPEIKLRLPGHGHAPPGHAVNTTAQNLDIDRTATPATVTA